jgi:hypothetical protein
MIYKDLFKIAVAGVIKLLTVEVLCVRRALLKSCLVATCLKGFEAVKIVWKQNVKGGFFFLLFYSNFFLY